MTRIDEMPTFEDVLAERHRRDPQAAARWQDQALAREVSVALAGWRAAHGMSQSALARRMGVSQPVIARLEIGEHEPSTTTLRKIADATGLVFTVTIGQGETRVMVTQTVGTAAAVA